MMSINSLKKFSLSEFLKILINRINSFSEMEDSLISSDIEKYLQTEEDKKKFLELIKKSRESSEKENNEAIFSNGDRLSIK